MIFTFCFALLLSSINAQTQRTTIWTQQFTTFVAPTVCQCQSWADFWQFWIGDASQVISITLGGSLTSTTYGCSGSAAQQVADVLRFPTVETQINCGSATWFAGAGNRPYGAPPTVSGTAVGVSTPIGVCSVNPAMRPCWADHNYGGIGNGNCDSPTQTFTVTVVSNVLAPTSPPSQGKRVVSNSCLSQLNDTVVANAAVTISCNSVRLQCHSGYAAVDFEPASWGWYSCTNNLWIPAAPSCTPGYYLEPNALTIRNLPMIATTANTWWWPFLFGSVILVVVSAIVIIVKHITSLQRGMQYSSQ